MKTMLKQLWCARGHGGIFVAPCGDRWFCKRCGKRVSLR